MMHVGAAMSEWSTTLPAIIILLLVVGILTLLILMRLRKESKTKEQDFRVFFVLGIIFLPLGIVLSLVVSVGFLGIAVVGFIDILIGLIYRGKWK
jgi:amino acid transporter